MNAITIHLVETDVAVVKLPAGGIARVHHPSGPRDYPPVPRDEPVFLVVPGDRERLGGGATHSIYYDETGLRNGRHRHDRAVWHAAARAARRGDVGDVVLIHHEEQTRYGRTRWAATGLTVCPSR
ncbi:hypothetical protein ACFY05_32230 [Microtetraspora fusca]|uniref:Uncharacterized protein n=1 Tax=Microtetraspora fusca TaxID=1997 RepID=A0ABW6VE73_MICFU